MNDRLRDRFRFRVWDEENHILHILQDGKKYDCDSVEIAFDGSLIGTSFNDEIERKEHSISYLGGENCVLEQCTGIKDINDKFIYEGDIIDAIIPLNMRPDLRIRHVIVFQKGAFGSIDKGLFGPLCNYGYNCKYEILGNIHENPELLEGK